MEYIDTEIFLGKINKNQNVVKKKLLKKKKKYCILLCTLYTMS